MNGKTKTGLVTGCNGQDGSYLLELLLNKGYKVYGMIRRSSTNTTERINHILNHPNLELVEGDVTDAACMHRLISGIRPDEIYNCAAQSDVSTSFNIPSATFDVNAVGVLNILETIRIESPKTRLYHCSTSELFGNSSPPQNENTPMIPQSPYGIAKLAAHNLIRLYREAYGIFACAGLLMNHESPRRGEKFVTRKITIYIANLLVAMEHQLDWKEPDEKNSKIFPKLGLGNLDAKRDWGFAGDYVRAMWMMLQQDKPVDYIIASGKAHSIREFLDLAFGHVGLDYKDYIIIDPKFFRPAEVNHLCGNSDKARRELGWSPEISFKQLVFDMVDSDLEARNK